MTGEYDIDQVDIYSQTDPPVELNTLSQPVESLLGQLAYASPINGPSIVRHIEAIDPTWITIASLAGAAAFSSTPWAS